MFQPHMQTTSEERPTRTSSSAADVAQIEQLATAMLQENLLQNVALTLQNAMVSSLQQAAMLPPNSAAAAALNLQALESYLTLQRLTTNGRIDILKIATGAAKIAEEGAATTETDGEFWTSVQDQTWRNVVRLLRWRVAQASRQVV